MKTLKQLMNAAKVINEAKYTLHLSDGSRRGLFAIDHDNAEFQTRRLLQNPDETDGYMKKPYRGIKAKKLVHEPTGEIVHRWGGEKKDPQTESWDWKTELERAHKETSNVGKHAKVSDDGEGGFDPKRHGLYKADPSSEVLSPGQVQKRAEAYIHQYGQNGYKIEGVGKNADGSWSFTTIKGGKVVHHTFHKTGGRTQSVGGDVVDHDETANDEVKPQSPRGKPADFSALYRAMGLSTKPPQTAIVPTAQKEKALKSIKQGGRVKVGNVTINRLADTSESTELGEMSYHSDVNKEEFEHIKTLPHKTGSIIKHKPTGKLYHVATSGKMALIENVDLDEGVDVSTYTYETSHSKSPRGHGYYYFSPHRSIDFNRHKEGKDYVGISGTW